MDIERLKQLLEAVKKGDTTVEKALVDFKRLPFEDVGCATVDHHRALRQGFPEVIYGAGKTPDEIVRIMDRMFNDGDNILVTRLNPEAAPLIRGTFSPRVPP